MVAEGDKKIKVDQEASDHIDAALVLSIEKLQEVQDKLEKVNEEASDRVLDIEHKYNEIRRPVYLRRSEIIASIPDFWLTAFLSHPALCDLFSEEDQKIFKYLNSLDVVDSKDVKSGYSITFNFKPNPYFEDIKLTKVLTFLDDESTKITGTNIKWKEGMNPTNVHDTTDKVDHDKTGNKRPFFDVSFFTWFGETAANEKSYDVFQDEVAELIKEDLWPNPLRYFSNVDEDDSDLGAEDLDGDKDEENGNEEDS